MELYFIKKILKCEINVKLSLTFKISILYIIFNFKGYTDWSTQWIILIRQSREKSKKDGWFDWLKLFSIEHKYFTELLVPILEKSTLYLYLF